MQNLEKFAYKMELSEKSYEQSFLILPTIDLIKEIMSKYFKKAKNCLKMPYLRVLRFAINVDRRSIQIGDLYDYRQFLAIFQVFLPKVGFSALYFLV